MATKKIKIISKRGTGCGSKWISKIDRNGIYVRDGERCLYCGTHRKAGIVLTLDHVLAASEGGSDEPSNLVTVCVSCNSSKGAKSTRAWFAYMRDVLGLVTDHIVKESARLRRLVIDREAGKAIVAREQAIKDYFSTSFTVRA